MENPAIAEMDRRNDEEHEFACELLKGNECICLAIREEKNDSETDTMITEAMEQL